MNARLIAWVLSLAVLGVVPDAMAQRWCVKPSCVKVVPKAAPVVTRTVSTSNNDNSVTFNTSFQFNQPTAAQGTTQFAYADIVPDYGSLDIGAYMNLSARLVQNAQQLAGQAHGDFTAASAQAFSNIAEIARIKAAEQAAVAALSAAGSQGGAQSGQLVTRQFSFEATIGPDGSMTLKPAEPSPPAVDQGAGGGGQAFDLAALGAAVRQVAATRCVECHNATTKKGNLDLTDPTTLAADAYSKELGILDRISRNDDKRMPPPDRDRLDVDEASTFQATYRVLKGQQ